MSSTVVLELRSCAAAALSGDPVAVERLSTTLQGIMVSAAEDKQLAECALNDICDFFEDESAAAQLSLPLVAIEILFSAARCGAASDAGSTLLQRLLTMMLATCSPREIFSAVLEVVQHFSSTGDWLVQRRALLPCLRSLPALLAGITRRRHLFLPDCCAAGLAVARCLGEGMTEEQGAVNEPAPEAIPPPISEEVSYAARQEQEHQARLRAGRQEPPSPTPIASGQELYMGSNARRPLSWQAEEYAALADFFSGVVQVGTEADAPALRALLLRLLMATTLGVITDAPSHQRDRTSDTSVAAASALATSLLEHLPRLGVTAGSIVLQTASTAEAWREFWGIALASSDGNEAAHGVGDGSEGGIESGDDEDQDGGGVEEEEMGDDRGVAEGGILGGVLLYWLLRLDEGHVLLAPSGPLELIAALSDSYSHLMQIASQRKSVGGALKALHLAANIGAPLATATAESSANNDTALASCLPLLQSLVMTMAQHPVHIIRSAAHRSLQVAMGNISGDRRLAVYAELLESAAPAAAALLLQCVQRDAALAWESSPSSGGDGFSGAALFRLAAQWVDPDGRHGWRGGLVENAEPLSVALGFLRFMLLRQRAATKGSPPILEIPEDGLATVRRQWLPALAALCSAVLTDMEGDKEDGAVGVRQGTELAVMLAVMRVREVTAWLQDVMTDRR